MIRTTLIAAAIATGLTAGAVEARTMRHHASATAGSAATRDLNNRQLASMDNGGGAMAQPSGSGAMGSGPAMSSGTSTMPGAAGTMPGQPPATDTTTAPPATPGTTPTPQ